MRIKEKNFQAAKTTVFRLIQVRLRSEKEIRDKLKGKKFPKEVIEHAVEYFSNIDLINDRIFAQKWITYRLAKPYGLHRIRAELRIKGIQKGILEEEIDKILPEFPEEEIVKQLANKRATKYKNIESDKIKTRVYQYLSRRGFSGSVILKAVKEL